LYALICHASFQMKVSFPRFVLKCELNLPETPNLDAMERPAWWPPDMPFSEAILAQRTQRGVSHLFLVQC
jgi:hypothetical protein